MIYTGIDIGGTKCAVLLGNENGEVLDRLSFETTEVNETLNRIFESVSKIGKGQAIGISCGGPLNSEKGIILSPPNLPGWDRIPVTRMLTEQFGIPAYLQNDADACALAEWKFGAGRGVKNMIFLTFGTGMGAGLILNNALYSGSCDIAGEIGHVRMAKYGPVGYGKSGAFEGFCSGSGIAQLGMSVAREVLQKGKTASFCKSMEELQVITAKKIAEQANAGLEDAMEVFRQCGEMLGYGLAILIDILNPQKIVMGSIYARCENLLRDSMMQVLKQECLELSLGACQIVPATLGEQIGDVAALCVAMNGENNHGR